MRADKMEDAVVEIMKYVLYKDEEITDGQVPEGAVIVEGVIGGFGFHPERLDEKRELIVNIAKQLPTEFQVSRGGGWSFLNLCETKDGDQWTGLHRICNELICLLKALRMADWLLPREMWKTLPGGVPYLSINLEGWAEGEMPMEVHQRESEGARDVQ